MLKSIVNNSWKLSVIYFIWVIIHFSSSHLYSKFCNDFSLIGFVSSPFMITAPHCIAFRWSIRHGADALTSMWIFLGTWLLSCLTPATKKRD